MKAIHFLPIALFLPALGLAIPAPAEETSTKKPTALVQDDFTTPKHPTRKPLRGTWKVADGVASVVQDDESYKKHNNHGPILVYEVEHSNATAVTQFKSKGCKAVVFTMDAVGGGHAFRVIMRSKSAGKPGTIQTYAEKQGNEKAKPIVLNREVPMLADDQWQELKVTVKGDRATVEIAGKKFEVSHPRIAQKKKIAKLGFSFGQIAIRKFELVSL